MQGDVKLKVSFIESKSFDNKWMTFSVLELWISWHHFSWKYFHTKVDYKYFSVMSLRKLLRRAPQTYTRLDNLMHDMILLITIKMSNDSNFELHFNGWMNTTK